MARMIVVTMMMVWIVAIVIENCSIGYVAGVMRVGWRVAGVEGTKEDNRWYCHHDDIRFCYCSKGVEEKRGQNFFARWIK